MNIVKFDIEVKINYRRLQHRIMQSNSQVPDWLDSMIKQALKECTPLPRAVYSFFPCSVDNTKNEIIIENKQFCSEFLFKRFKNARELGLFIATIGNDSGERSRKAAKEKDGLMALIYDSIGSEYAESTANAIHKIIEEEKGYCMNRYSPGYNDWHISEQKYIFDLIDGSKIGVKLNESFLMTPEKSVSAMIGYSDKIEQKSCKDCKNKNCVYRGL